ncbi:MAG TPA: RNA polymerase sigma factor RpoD/SigA [Candidatus Cloacimonadota bacterium]|nr:RNA polymerase sigma factor RpoD/SigA [Candidatus Cloacimonadota bacterium]
MSENVFADRALQNYLSEISKFQTLPREVEHDLAIKARNGDKNALNKLIQSNLKFVVKIATRFQNRGLTLSELISEGNIGLIKALEKFNPDMDIKLISYAIWWIKQRIMMAIAEKNSMIRVPLGKTNTANRIRAKQERIFNETGEAATIEDLEKEMDIEGRMIRNIQDQIIETVSLDDPNFNQSSSESFLSDYLEDTDSKDPQQLYFSEKFKDDLDHAIKNLEPREAYIIKTYFGLQGEKGKNFAQIAEDLGLSRERVRQIQKQALKKILRDVYPKDESYVDFFIAHDSR